MILTDVEKAILDGKEGTLKQKALEFIVRYAKVLDAEKLCKVTKAHLFAGAHGYLRTVQRDVDNTISLMHFCSEETLPIKNIACYSQTDSGPMDPDQWEILGFTQEESRENQEYLDRYLRAGIHLVGSCIPYMLGFIPTRGEHYVSTESHAIIFMNSLWGACGNADGIEAAFCSAVSGRTPLWGNHIMDNRKGNILFHIESKPQTISDWDLVGFTVGKKIPSFSIPVLNGSFELPDSERMRSSFASMATTGGIELCHIVGLTPEAITLSDAFGGTVPKDAITITEKDISEAQDFLCSGNLGKIQFVSLGCPHYSIEQIKKVADFLSNKKVHEEVELQIWTAAPIKSIADKCGYTSIIFKAGGKLVCGSCPILTNKWPRNASGIAFDSVKQANYMKPRTGSTNLYYGSMEKCLEAAINGEWD